MTEREFQTVSKEKRWPTGVDVTTDYLFVYLIPAGLLLLGVLGIAAGLSGKYLIFMIALVSGSIPLGFYLHKRVRNANCFFTLDIPTDSKKLVRSAVKQIKWKLVEETDRYIIATSSATLLSWGEINTIVFTESEVQFNSKPSMQTITLYASEKVNSRKLLKAIKEIEIKEGLQLDDNKQEIIFVCTWYREIFLGISTNSVYLCRRRSYL